ncbi:MAG: hypothetical protein LC777_15930, partial [Actinobacteria bacterium]|nr:hypothetical protein [Actinomycetota bacterium]
SVHSEFTLPGSGWAQNVRAQSGVPRLGLYVLEVPMPTVDTCRIFVSVRATATKRQPTAGRGTVRLTLGSTREVVRFDQRGRHGSLRWWTGSQTGYDAAGMAVQRMPSKLRTERHRWLVYRFGVQHRAVSTAEDACEARATRTGGRTVRSIARTLRIANGPALSEPPVLPIS